MPDLRVDTAKLRAYAQRIEAVNRRIRDVDSAMNSIYFQYGLLDMLRILQADLLIHYSATLERCSAYLNDTAERFETVERMLMNENPLTFTALPALPAGLFFQPASTGLPSVSFGDPDTLLLTLGALMGNPDYVFSGGISTDLDLFGYSLLHNETVGSLFTGKADAGAHAEFDLFDENGNLDLQNIGFGANAEASGTVAELTSDTELLNGNIRIHDAVQILTGGVVAEGQFRLYEDGKFNPQLVAALYGEAHGVHGEHTETVGDNMFGGKAFADGDIGYAAGGAELRYGDLGNGEFGLDTRAAAIASGLHGEVGGTATAFGIDFTAAVGGDVGSVGAEANLVLTNRRFGVGGKLAEVLGLEADIMVDWSDNEPMCCAADYTMNSYLDTATYVGDIGENAFNAFSNVQEDGFGNALYNFASDTWDDTTEFVGNRVDATVEFAGDMWDAGGDFVDDCIDSAADFVSDWVPFL